MKLISKVDQNGTQIEYYQKNLARYIRITKDNKTIWQMSSPNDPGVTLDPREYPKLEETRGEIIIEGIKKELLLSQNCI